MADHLTLEKRSWNMSLIRSTDTKPEIIVRKLLHSLGYRFRLHKKGLPGKPDIVLKKHKTVIFVHGCFWHQHKGCKRSNIPKSNTSYWKPKLNRNVKRDKKHKADLKRIGWKTIVIWECETKNLGKLEKKIKKI
ncbi:MAG: DNA mismatch endonuclease Vsr [Candidatus Saelkia tenebricola]|nr:DNA mismatch endonuclease Vsr [Candidatus Saelkia tenebricola]